MPEATRHLAERRGECRGDLIPVPHPVVTGRGSTCGGESADLSLSDDWDIVKLAAATRTAELHTPMPLRDPTAVSCIVMAKLPVTRPLIDWQFDSGY